MRWLVLLAALGVLGCGARPGSALITITFQNETQTRCVRVSARQAGGTTVVNAAPTSLDRTGDELIIGLAETDELTGELEITVFRFEQAGCVGRSFASASERVTVTKGEQATVTFTFRGEAPDGGADAGVDAGCGLDTCPAPLDCQELAVACVAPGTCMYSAKPVGTTCDGGVCSGGQCIANTCTVMGEGAECNDGLPCTNYASCASGVCRPVQCIAAAPECRRVKAPITQCDQQDPTRCEYEADPTRDDQPCNAGQGQCLAGACQPWLPPGFVPRFFDNRVSRVPYPVDPWVLESPDGGPCSVVLTTSGDTPTAEDGGAGCGLPSSLTASLAGDGGISLFTMTGLSVGPNVTLHLTGTRPAQLLVLGDATIDGLISVAPQLLGVRPAGAHPVDCLEAGAGTSNKHGGGGGGFGAVGGVGGNSGGAGGGASQTDQVLRGGCVGGKGRADPGVAVGGIGGGAVDLIVSGTLTLRNGGAVTASGGGGMPGVSDNHGGGGGGSGGMVVLEASALRILDGGAVTANGGGGGEGGKNNETSAPGPMGSLTTATRVANAGTSPGGGNGGRGGAGIDATGEAGADGSGGGNPGGGGGGGGIGVLLLRSRTPCVFDGGVLSGFRTGDSNCP